MKRREFFEKSGCTLAGIALAGVGLKAGMTPGEEEDRKAMVKQMLMEKMGKTEAEAEAMLAEMEKKLPLVKQMCICKTCPTYVADETQVGFCHPLVGKSMIITKEKGCNCPTCPAYKKMELKNGYYCTRKSEMEQEIAKKA